MNTYYRTWISFGAHRPKTMSEWIIMKTVTRRIAEPKINANTCISNKKAQQSLTYPRDAV